MRTLSDSSGQIWIFQESDGPIPAASVAHAQVERLRQGHDLAEVVAWGLAAVGGDRAALAAGRKAARAVLPDLAAEFDRLSTGV